MKIYILLIILLFSALFIPLYGYSDNINFFIDYNFLTFSSFDKLVNTSQTNIKLFLEYNPIIPIYLNWHKSQLVKKIKGTIQQNKIHLYKADKGKKHDISPQERWFINMQSENDEKIFSDFIKVLKISRQPKIKSIINILNFNELSTLLNTITQKKMEIDLNFKLDLSLLLYKDFNRLMDVLKNYPKHRFCFYLHSDTRYSASKKEINRFIDLIYMLKTQKKLNKAEKKIFDLSYMLFTTKLFKSMNDIMLNLFPLTTNAIKKYKVSSMEYDLKDRKYITLFDKENYFTFDTKTGYLKKWFLHNKGECLINFDSFVEKIYLKTKRESKVIPLKNIQYYKFDNGLMFKYDSGKSLLVEKNVILQYKKILLTYKIKNTYKRRRSFILVLENRFSPSLLYNLRHLENNFAFYPYKKSFTGFYNDLVHSFINLNTGYGISWNYYHSVNGVEFFNDFYNYIKKIYYKFTLYPYEQKVITISYRKKYIKRNKRKPYLNKARKLTNQYYGDYNID